MEGIVFFGKGGIGKSTIAASITAVLASSGKKVLHLGCDPKMDSTLVLMGERIRPFSSRSGVPGRHALAESVFHSRFKGVHCIEAGGPQPGVGCAGTAIGSMLDAIKDHSLLETGGYDAAVFDVLGDVVCGGFAAPLRRGFAKKAVIVTSEETLSLYAANRLIMMLENYARNGVYLAGLAANTRTPAGTALVRAFARAVNTRVLGAMPRDPAVTAAERAHIPAVLAYPESPFAGSIRKLCAAVRGAVPPATPPRAMSDADFFAFSGSRLKEIKPAPGPAPRGKGKTAGRQASPASLLAAAGFRPAGLQDNQLICDWESHSGTAKVLIGPASTAGEGRAAFSDWTVCFHPSEDRKAPSDWTGLTSAARRLSALRFDEIRAVLAGGKDFYGLINVGGPEDRTLAAPDTPRRPHTGFGQWDRFIFPAGLVEACIPPGSVMVEHGDSECRFCACEGGAMGMFSEAAGPGAAGGARSGPRLPRPDARIVNTDFNNTDAVFGDADKTLRALYGAAARSGPGGLVEFYAGCTPLMLASDTVSLASRVEKEKGVKIVLEPFNSFHEHSPEKARTRAEFMARRLARAAVKPSVDACFANWGEAARPMRELLAERGISSVIPGKDFYRDARSARLQVLSCPDTVLEPAFTAARMKWILPGAPYGFSGTGAWLSAVARALGRKKRPAGPSSAQLAEAARLRARAKRFAAAFVLAPEEIGLLSGSAALKRVPVLPVLAEAGFQIRLLVSGGAGKAYLSAKTPAALAALRRSLPGLRVSAAAFAAPEELRSLLRDDEALRLVYSDVRRDPRAAAAGKTPFSAALFEPGYSGALETWRRLLDLCEWDFNERYFLEK